MSTQRQKNPSAHLFPQLVAVKSDDVGQQHVEHVRLIAAQLRGSEGGHALQQQLSSALGVLGGQQEVRLVHLKAVAAVPVA